MFMKFIAFSKKKINILEKLFPKLLMLKDVSI